MDWSTALVTIVSIICTTVLLVNILKPNAADKELEQEIASADADKEVAELVSQEYKILYEKMRSENERLHKLIVPGSQSVKET